MTPKEPHCITSLSSIQKGDLVSNHLRVVPTHPGQIHHLLLLCLHALQATFRILVIQFPMKLQTRMGTPCMGDGIILVIWKECPFWNEFTGGWLIRFFLLRVELYESDNPIFLNAAILTWTFEGTNITPSSEISFWKIN